MDGPSDGKTHVAAQDYNFMQLDNTFSPMVGETCSVSSPRTDCPTAQSELKNMHWLMRNADYDQDVYDSWKAQGCYAQIAANLGFRLSLTAARASRSVKVGSPVGFYAQLVNSGYARPHNPRPINLVVRDHVGHIVKARFAGADWRLCAPRAPITLAGSVSTAGLVAGPAIVAIELPDNDSTLATIADYSTRLDQASGWEASTGLNVVANISLRP